MLSEHSEAAVPGFAVIKRAKPDGPGRYLPLAVDWAEQNWPMPGRPSEHVVQRYMGIVKVAVITDDAGRTQRAPEVGPLTTAQLVCTAGGVFALTNERLIGLVGSGVSAFGDIDYDRRVLILSMELADVVDVALIRDKPTGHKYRGLRLDSDPFGFASLDIMKVVDEKRYGSRTKYADIAKVVVRTVAARHRALGIGDETLRVRSEAEQYAPVDNDLVALFVHDLD